VQPDTQLHGRDGIRRIIGQLQGLELPGPAWERDILPMRIAQYSPGDLEQLCLAGEVAWGRLGVTCTGDDDNVPPLPLPRPAGENSPPLHLPRKAGENPRGGSCAPRGCRPISPKQCSA